MFSFMKIATFAALAFGTLASAIPAPAPAPAAEAGALVTRTSPDVTAILTQLSIDLENPCKELSGVSADVSVQVVTDLVAKITLLIQTATTACGSASGLGSGNILLLLSVCIKLVISACGTCYNTCTDKVDILVVLQLLDGVLAALVSVVLKLVGGVLAVVIGLLVGLLGTVVQLILSLKFTACAKVLLLL
ncbi:hypothetical protein PENSPDRAFT_751174 [Peniophora sp. CONT]|nr:hypothetical protein PENSPDRAFT_751174 [Peniophora sp. CONT]